MHSLIPAIEGILFESILNAVIYPFSLENAYAKIGLKGKSATKFEGYEGYII